MSTAVLSKDLELRRRVAGLKFSELARLSGLPYMRVWRCLNGTGQLTDAEQASIGAALDALDGVSTAGSSDISTREQSSE